jgi:hypothetical protein
MRQDLKFCFGSISVPSVRCCGYRGVVWHSSLPGPGSRDGAARRTLRLSPWIAAWTPSYRLLLPPCPVHKQQSTLSAAVVVCCHSNLFHFVMRRRLHCADGQPPPPLQSVILRYILEAAARSAEISVCAYQSTRCHVACDSNFLLNSVQ